MYNHIKSDKYNKQFVLENIMGPNPLYMLEEICDLHELKPGMRVLDLGCGKGLTSLFLAKEYGVTVFATDLWITATENYERFKQLGFADKIIPIHADANELPYADEYFDVAVAIDSYHYFGVNETYLPEKFAKLVKKGGWLGVAFPGLTRDVGGVIPEAMRGYWDQEEDAFGTFKTAEWWKNCWQNSGMVDVMHYREIENAREIWYEWAKVAREKYNFNDDLILDADTDRLLTLIIMTAVRK
jgi:cyclopropane fatty-acyl-phospholipid synthase-like methyltransferase